MTPVTPSSLHPPAGEPRFRRRSTCGTVIKAIRDSSSSPADRRSDRQPWLSSLSAVPQARCARNPRRCQVLLTDRPERALVMTEYGVIHQ